MGQIKHVNETVGQSIMMEHYRLHCAERMPDSPYKEAVLSAVRSALERLERAVEPDERPACTVCASRKASARVLMFPSSPKSFSAVVASVA
jgi:hypothetical protein